MMGELAILGTRLTAAHRRIEKPRTPLRRLAREFGGEIGGRRRVIHHDRTPLHSRQNAAVTERDAPDIVVVADAHEHDVRVPRRLPRSRRRLSPVLTDPLIPRGPPCGCRPGGHAPRQPDDPAIG